MPLILYIRMFSGATYDINTILKKPESINYDVDQDAALIYNFTSILLLVYVIATLMKSWIIKSLLFFFSIEIILTINYPTKLYLFYLIHVYIILVSLYIYFEEKSIRLYYYKHNMQNNELLR